MHDTSPTARLPACLPDKLTFGLAMRVGRFDPRAADDFRHALSEAGLVRRWRGRWAHIEVPFAVGQATASVAARLDISDTPAGELLIGPKSMVEVNGMRLLRAALGERASGPPGADRNTNVVGHTGDRQAQLLQLLLPVIVDGIDALEAALDGAMPPLITERGDGTDAYEVLDQALWLRAAEACTDLAVGDAPRLARALRWAPPPDTGEVHQRTYATGSVTPAGGLPVAGWRRPGGVYWKAYCKRLGDNLLRVEAAAPNTKAIRELGAGGSVELGGAEAVGLVTAILAALEADVTALVLHAGSVGDGGATRAECVHALNPLYALAYGEDARRGPGATVSPPTREAARAAYGDLLETGICRARNAPAKGSLRKVLDTLAGPDGPLVRDGHYAIFCLAPRYAMAWAG